MKPDRIGCGAEYVADDPETEPPTVAPLRPFAQVTSATREQLALLGADEDS